MLKTRQRPNAARRCIRHLSRLSSVVVPRRLSAPIAVRSWNRMTILFYSSIISTAAAADVSVKRRRRRQWDVAIAEIENSIEAMTEPSPRLESPLYNSSPGEFDFGPALNEDTAPTRPESRREEMSGQSFQSRQTTAFPANITPQVPNSRPMAEALSQLSDTPGILTAKVQENARVASTSIYASDFRRNRRVMPWTPKKLVTVEYSVAKLATRLLIEAQGGPSGDQKQVKDLEETLRDIEQRLFDIRKVDTYDLQGLKRLQYPQFSLDAKLLDNDSVHLTNSLHKAIRNYALGDISYGMTLRKIAYSLLMSPVPPNCDVYCLLINRFTRMEHYRIANIVNRSLIESHVRHNEMSATAVLSHHLQTRDHGRFDDFVRRIQGLDGGLMLARSDIWIGVGSSRLRQHEGKIVQALEVNGPMAYLIVRGYLSFGEENLAMEWFISMQNKGLRPRPKARFLNAFLQYYAIHGQWESGRAIWEQMHAQRFLSPTSENYTADDENRAFYSALRLCKNCGKSKEFRTIYKEALSRGIPMDKLLRPVRRRRGFSLAEDLAEKRKRAIHILEHRVALLIEDTLSWALHALVSKMLLLNFSIADVEALFRHFGAEDSWTAWFRSRPWLWRRKWTRVVSSDRVETSAISKQILSQSVSGQYILKRSQQPINYSDISVDSSRPATGIPQMLYYVSERRSRPAPWMMEERRTEESAAAC